jgi:hypothetical protein
MFRGTVFGCFGVVIALGLLLMLSEPGRAVRDIWSTGVVQDLVRKPEMRTYDGTAEDNLRALHTALIVYSESEGQLPPAEGWMDAIESRLRTSDMTQEEANKKLQSPTAGDGEFGYAMNAAASGEWEGDLDPKMPLIFESRDLSRNAHGAPDDLVSEPAPDRPSLAITVDGTIVTIPDESP